MSLYLKPNQFDSKYRFKVTRPTMVPDREEWNSDGITLTHMLEYPPAPPPLPTIGTVTATGPDLTGTNVELAKDSTTEITAAIDGDVTDATYRWKVRSGDEFVSISGSSDLKHVTLLGVAGGLGTVRCTVSSVTASDSPQQITLSVTVIEPSGPEDVKKVGAEDEIVAIFRGLPPGVLDGAKRAQDAELGLS